VLANENSIHCGGFSTIEQVIAITSSLTEWLLNRGNTNEILHPKHLERKTVPRIKSREVWQFDLVLFMWYFYWDRPPEYPLGEEDHAGLLSSKRHKKVHHANAGGSSAVLIH
jgi:hypothetical protein